MPGPGSRAKKAKSTAKKPKPAPSTSNEAPDPFVQDVDNAYGWDIVVDILCEVFELPDLTTRSGLKRVHANFESIYRRLDKAYEKNASVKIRGGIVGIFAKMCADSILRNKLFEKGILKKLLPLLDVSECRRLALRALTNITHHGGIDVRVEIARHTPTILRIIDEHGDDPKVAELGISTLVHSVNAVIHSGETRPDQALFDSLDMAAIFRVVLAQVRAPTASHTTINHAVDLLSSATLNCAPACQACPQMLTFLTAGLRSSDWVFRCTALGGLVSLHWHHSEPDQLGQDPMKLMAAVRRGFPDHLSDAMMEYGPTRCETYITLNTSSEFTRAMMTTVQTRDLYALGLQLAGFIPRTEFSITDGTFQVEDPVTGRRENMGANVGLPFTMWSDSLPHCAKAIREKGRPGEADLADILDIKYHIMRRRISDAIALAQRALQRSPDIAYFHYAISLSGDAKIGLRAAKKGMKCKITSPFIHFQMMQRAVEHAGDMGILALQGSPSDQKWEEGIAFLMSALEDAKSYIDQAPPDNRHMKNVSYWFILLTLAIRGPEMSENLSELDGALKRLKLADDFSDFLGIPPPKTRMRLAQAQVVKLYSAAVKEWGPVIARFDTLLDTPPVIVTPGKVEDDLAAWLEDEHAEHGAEYSHPKVSVDAVALYRCSWCGNPSAVLRKCSGCAKTRYCDSGCQKAHWAKHKKFCTAASA